MLELAEPAFTFVLTFMFSAPFLKNHLDQGQLIFNALATYCVPAPL